MNAISTMPTIDYDRVRREITERMAAASLSQHAVAEATGGVVDQSGLSKFLRGASEKLGLEYIEAIAAALGCTRADLTGEALQGPQGEGWVRTVPWNRVIPSPQNPRTDMDPDALDGLMQSIVARGVLQNLRGRPDGMGSYFIIAGHRRHAAVGLAVERELLPDTFPMPLAVDDVDDAEALTQALIENLHREDMHPLDEAHAYERLQELNGWSAVDVAGAIRKEDRYVQQRIRLLEKLSPAAVEAFRKKTISFTQARELCGADHDVQQQVMNKMESGWYSTTNQLAGGVRQLQAEKERLEEAKQNPAPKQEREPSIPQLSNEERAERKAAAEAEQEAEKAAMAVKVRQFNTLFRSALRARPGTVARNALLDIIAPYSGAAMSSSVVGKLRGGQEAAFCGLLGVDPPPSAESVSDDGPEDNWVSRAVAAIKALDDHRATETLLLAIAATASPAGLCSDFLGYNQELWFNSYRYHAEVSSPMARSLAGFLGVHVPADMQPPEPATPEPDDDEIAGAEGIDGEHEEAKDVDG